MLCNFFFCNLIRCFIETNVVTFLELHFVIVHIYFSLQPPLQFRHFYQFSGCFISHHDRSVCSVYATRTVNIVDITIAMPLSSLYHLTRNDILSVIPPVLGRHGIHVELCLGCMVGVLR